MTGYTEYIASYSASDQHTDVLDGYFPNLLPGIQYYFQALITNSLGSSSSDVLSYMTPINNPAQALAEITPNPTPSSISSNSASIEGFITNNGAAYTHFTEYSASPDFNNYIETYRENQVDSLKVSWVLTGLEPETTYYYRHIAYNDGGTTISNTYSFMTTILNSE
jgi:hypothetical protein